MKRHISRQRETWGVFLLTLAAVLAYAVWGSMLLNAQHQASSAPTGTTLVANR